MANNLALKIEKLLAEELGDFIAKATVKKNCELIGATMETLTAAQLPEFADKVSKSVSFFIDDVKGEELAKRIRDMVA